MGGFGVRGLGFRIQFGVEENRLKICAGFQETVSTA